MPKLPVVLVALLMTSLLPLTGLAQDGAQAAPKPRPAATDRGCVSPRQKVDEQGFVRIGGIEQWVTVRGSRCANPMVLFLHGGPGNPLSPFASTVYGAWEKDFTLVQWDQRGAGRTYGRNKPDEESTLTLEQMTKDGVELADHLVRRFGKQKLILMGGSWGSILGVHMIKARPELFHAYVGTAQFASYRENQRAAYDTVMARARAAGDAESVAKLEALGSPPWTNPRHPGALRRIIRKHEAQATTPAPKAWWVPAPAYATPEELANSEAGDDYSYIRFVGFKGDGMAASVDLYELGTTLEVPVFLIQGTEDLLTRPEVTQRYFERLKAPHKELVRVPRAGHDPNEAVVAAQYRVLKERVLPRVKGAAR